MNDRLLIVEDELVVAFDLQMILEKAGYVVCGIASSYEQAISLINDCGPELVLIDIHLKGRLTGIHLAKELKKKRIPFVFLSANNNKKVIDAAMATEPYGFLVKPFREKDLLLALEVARYRHRDFLQLLEKRRVHLCGRFQEIKQQQVSRAEKIAGIAGAIQSFFPFDLFAIFTLDELNAPDGISVVKTEYDKFTFRDFSQTLENLRLSADQVVGFLQSFAIEHSGTLPDEPINEIFESKFLTLESQMKSAFQFGVYIESKFFALSFFTAKKTAVTKSHLEFLKQVGNPLTRSINYVMSHPEYPVEGRRIDPERQMQPEEEVPAFEGIIGESLKMQSVFDQIKQIAPFDDTVLIIGDTGTGKERVAHAIHKRSSRAREPFVVIDCAAMADPLIEIELFGYERETWEGILEIKAGKFENADGGTVFLDEITAMPMAVQLQLLTIIQKKEIKRTGSSSPTAINLRFIVSTNRHMENEIAKGLFRLDLYFRLNAFPVKIPQLHERRNDVLYLAKHFGQAIAKTMRKDFLGISDNMKDQLLRYHWPGNVRELKNIIEHALIMNDGKSPLELSRNLGIQ